MALCIDKLHYALFFCVVGSASAIRCKMKGMLLHDVIQFLWPISHFECAPSTHTEQPSSDEPITAKGAVHPPSLAYYKNIFVFFYLANIFCIFVPLTLLWQYFLYISFWCIFFKILAFLFNPLQNTKLRAIHTCLLQKKIDFLTFSFNIARRENTIYHCKVK